MPPCGGNGISGDTNTTQSTAALQSKAAVLLIVARSPRDFTEDASNGDQSEDHGCGVADLLMRRIAAVLKAADGLLLCCTLNCSTRQFDSEGSNRCSSHGWAP